MQYIEQPLDIKSLQVLQRCYHPTTFVEKVLLCTKSSKGAQHIDKEAVKQQQIAAAQASGEYTCSQFVTIWQLLLWPSSLILGM